jgi:NAD(P)-dependent dehydrogenase (short-subunit alcohol dehydrogenase family)
MLEDTAAVITGAASGIGRSIARTFAEEGADIVVADLQKEPREDGTPTHEVIASETDREATFVECDVTDKSDVEAAVEAAEGVGGVDVMVNNAGIFRSEEVLEVSEAEFDQLFDINVKGTFFGAQVAGERMVASDGGSIINLSSVAGLSGTGDYVTYCTSKGAVRLMTYSLADALGPEGVRVNAIHPGVIETEMTTDDVPIVGTDTGEGYKQTIPSRRFGEPEDIADAALFLASDLGDYVNGESLVVDGGMTHTG